MYELTKYDIIMRYEVFVMGGELLLSNTKTLHHSISFHPTQYAAQHIYYISIKSTEKSTEKTTSDFSDISQEYC